MASGSTSCDGLVAMQSASGYPLVDESFSSTYDCTSKSNAIKTTVIGIAGYGCCGGNSNGKAIVVFGCWFIVCIFVF